MSKTKKSQKEAQSRKKEAGSEGEIDTKLVAPIHGSVTALETCK